MKVSLSAYDRFVLPTVLPEKGAILTQLTVRDINKKCAITVEEAKAFEGKKVGETVDIAMKEIEFTEGEWGIIKSALDAKEKASEITQHTLNLAIVVRDAK